MWMSIIGCTKPHACSNPGLIGSSVEPDVFEMERLVVDTAERRSDPVCEFSRLGHAAAHEGLHEFIVFRARQPFEFVISPCLFGQHFAIGADEMPGKISNLAVKALVRQGQTKWNSSLIDYSLPAADAVRDFINVVVA